MTIYGSGNGSLRVPRHGIINIIQYNFTAWQMQSREKHYLTTVFFFFFAMWVEFACESQEHLQSRLTFLIKMLQVGQLYIIILNCEVGEDKVIIVILQYVKLPVKVFQNLAVCGLAEETFVLLSNTCKSSRATGLVRKLSYQHAWEMFLYNKIVTVVLPICMASGKTSVHKKWND